MGQRLPDFVGTDNGGVVGLTDVDGVPVRLVDLLGHPLWIYFWAT